MLRSIPFFSKLSDAEIESLSRICVEKSYKKGEFLFLEGEEPKWLNILLKGTIKIYKTTRSGKEIFLHTMRPISMVAELVNFEHIAYPASALCLTNSQILKIDYDKFERDFLLNPKICFEMLKSLSSKLKIMNEVLSTELTLKSDAKVAKFIVENSELFGVLKQIQIASVVNLAPETLSRIIADFKQKGLIEFNDDFSIKFVAIEELKGLYE